MNVKSVMLIQKHQPDLGSICLTLRWYSPNIFSIVDFDKNQQMTKNMKNFPGGKELDNPLNTQCVFI